MSVILNKPLMMAGDPFVLPFNGKYYLYSTTENNRPLEAPNAFDTNTGADDGIFVYESTDLVNWENKGLCLRVGDTYGKKWFWAPEVTYHKGKFYIAYSAEEHPAIAVSESPLGPFKQEVISNLRENRSIDGHIFIDDDGTAYFYYVRLGGGNKIYVAKLSDDLLSIEEEYEDCLICATEPWETVDSLVAEGPFVLKRKGIYYLVYSCNHTRSKDYAVGYATSTSPKGPFTRYDGNPILHRSGNIVGTGHNSFFTDPSDNQLYCAYHCHNIGTDNFKPRHLCLARAEFKEGDSPIDELRIYGPQD